MQRVNSRAKSTREANEVLKIPSGIDATTFFAPSIPDEIHQAFSLLHSMPVELIQSTIVQIIAYLNTGDTFTLPAKFYSSSELSADELNTVLTAIYLIIRTAVRTKTKLSVLKRDLNAMKLPDALAENICKALLKSRSPLEARAVANRIQFPKLHKLRWRIDVTISSGMLSRIMRPNILMQMILKDGTVKTFEISLEQFTQLRYSVAKVLHDIQTLERHPILKIVNEFKRREDEDVNN